MNTKTNWQVLVFVSLAISLPWLLAQSAVQGGNYELSALAIGGAVVAFYFIFRNWRAGIPIFLVWMLFEDLARKYMGNNMVIYFAKDALAGACCMSFYIARGKERRLKPRPKFFIPFVLFFAWALMEVFNPNSPSVWYGVVGLTLYFAFVPLFVLGYSLLRDELDLRRFLLVNLFVAGLIAALGVSQAITGKTLLAPAELAPDIRELGTLVRTAPVTGETFIRPTSVFVSDGRFAAFMSLAWLLAFGTAAFLFIRRLRGKNLVLLAMGAILAAILLSGSRSALMQSLIGAGALALAYLPQIRSRVRGSKILKSILAIALLAVGSIAFLVTFYPEALNSRLDFYVETLLPSSSASELGFRGWVYPEQEFLKAFTYPNWLFGNGLGTSSLGTQYVTRIMGAPASGASVESGYGNLVLELGIPGLFLWLFWTCALLRSQWRVLKGLRSSAVYPVAIVIAFFSFLLLFPAMTSGLGFENFVVNAYLCILLGIFFSLPDIAKKDMTDRRVLQVTRLSADTRRRIVVPSAY